MNELVTKADLAARALPIDSRATTPSSMAPWGWSWRLSDLADEVREVEREDAVDAEECLELGA